MTRTIVLAAALAAVTAALPAGMAFADDRPSPSAGAAADANAELTINVTGDRRPCKRWFYEWKILGNSGSGKRWKANCQ